MGKGVALLGAGGHAKVVIGALQSAGLTVDAIFDDDPRKQGTRILDLPIQGPLSLFDSAPQPAILAIGDNAARRRASEREAEWITLVHAAAWVHPSALLGPGTVVMAGAIVQPDARIGRHAIVNTGATVDHDCLLEDFVHVAPGCHLSGNTVLREGVMMGTGSSTRQGVDVGAWTVVGAGAAVVKSLPAGVVAAGVPAKVLRSAT